MRRATCTSPLLCLLLILTIGVAGCAHDELTDPAGPNQSVVENRRMYDAISLPDSLIFEDEPLLEIAKAMPTFAGFHYNDRGEVEILLTDVALLAEASGRVLTQLGAHSPGATRLIGRTATYPFLELARYRTVLRQGIFAIPGVVSLGVRESANRVKVGLEQAGAEVSVRKLMSELGVPQASVLFVVEGRGQDLVTAHRATTTTRGSSTLTLRNQQPNGRIQGGWEIGRSNAGCTLGFAALRRSDHLPVFITASHCTSVRTSYDGSVFTQPLYGHQVGSEILDPPSYPCSYPVSPCRNSDAAMIQAHVPIDLGLIARTTQASPIGCEHCAEPLTIDPTQPVFVIGARNDNVFENETLNKVGRTTGWTRGNVEDTCDDYKSGLAGANDPWIKQCSDRVDFSIDGGDSGSPVFSLAPNGTAVLRGIVFASQTCCLGYHDAWMSDLNQIEKDLGPLVVHDPGPPSVSIIGPSVVRPNVYCSWNGIVTNGVPPFSYQWSGMFSGTGATIQGNVGSYGGGIIVNVTDGFGRTTANAIQVVVEGEPGPIAC